MDPLVLLDVASSMLVFGMAAVFVVTYMRLYRRSAQVRAQDGTRMRWVIFGSAVWVSLKTGVPTATTLVETGSRTWRVPFNVASSVLIVVILLAVIRSMGERLERERPGRETGDGTG